jgi:hypothetical protein
LGLFTKREDDVTLIEHRNHKGRSWLHALVIAGNATALSITFSPQGGMAWRVADMIRYRPLGNDEVLLRTLHSEIRDIEGRSLRDTAKLLGRVEIEKIIDEFAAFYLLFDLHQKTTHSFKSSEFNVEDDLLMFSGEHPSFVARRVIRFSDEILRGRHGYAHTLLPIRSVISRRIQQGVASVFTWLFQAVPSLLDSPEVQSVRIRTRVNIDEFAQLELYDSKASEDASEDLDLGSLAAHGPSPRENDYLSDGCAQYAALLSRFIRRGGFRNHELTAFISTTIDDKYYMSSFGYKCIMMLKYKLSLLRDEEFLENRLELLRFFVSDSVGLVPPNAVDIVRWRNCGVLRWLVTESFVHLEALAGSNMQITHRLKYVTFLGNSTIPPTMTVGEFLLLASIEFDDLQTVEWLVEECGVRAAELRSNGWNIMHACAHYGRTEVALWFLSQDALVPLLHEPCSRKPADMLFVVHLAVQRGFVSLADLFLEAGGPSQDQNKKSVAWHAKKSKHEFVKVWGKSKGAANDKQTALEKGIVKLYDLFEDPSSDRVEKIKLHITKSECLYAERWLDCNFLANGPLGPLGKVYWEVVRRCCSATDADFIVWICRELSFSKDDWRLFQHSYTLLIFWECPPDETERITSTAIVELASRLEGNLLARCLEKPWACSRMLARPVNPLLQKLEEEYYSDPDVSGALGQYRDSLLRAHALENFLRITENEVGRALAKGISHLQVEGLLGIYEEVALDMSRQWGLPLSSYYENFAVSGSGILNLNLNLAMHGAAYSESHELQRQLLWRHKRPIELSSAWTVLVVESHEDLIRWSLVPERNGWTSKLEIDATRVAACFGHDKLIDIFLQRDVFFSSSKTDRLVAAALGAAEGGRVSDLALCLAELRNKGVSLQPMSSDLSAEYDDLRSGQSDKCIRVLSSSLAACAISYCLLSSEAEALSDCTPQFAILHWLRDNVNMDVAAFARAASLILKKVAHHFGPYDRFVDLFTYMVDQLDLNVWSCRSTLHIVSEAYITSISVLGRADQREGFAKAARRWFDVASSLGFDIQTVDTSSSMLHPEIPEFLSSLKANQRRQWAKFDVIKKGCALDTILGAFESGDLEMTSRDSEGFLVTHLAAAYDRVDVLQWLIESKGASLDSVSGFGRTVTQVAKASNASLTTLWLSRRLSSEVIAAFVSSRQRRRLAIREKNMALFCIKRLQARYRGRSERRVYQDVLQLRLESSRRFLAIWYRSLSIVASSSLLFGDTSWEAMKQGQHDVARSKYVIGDLDNGHAGISETIQTLEDGAGSWRARIIRYQKYL